MLGWSGIDISLLALLPALLVLSGFFSGSETALFALTATERMGLRRGDSFGGRAVEALLADQRLLLITVLLGNMTINVLYFVISSVLLMRSTTGLIGGFLLAAASLVLIILLGEVLPKLLANSRRAAFAAFVAPPLLALHQLIGPLRIGLDRAIVAPLSRLTAPTEAPPRLNREELAALVAISEREGVIDDQERRILHDVITLSQQKVRDVMTPRVRIVAVPATASRRDVVSLVERTRFTNLPVYEGDLDHITGMLQVRQYLLDEGNRSRPPADFTSPVRFVPEIAALDQLLTHFRETGTQVAIAVDEYGGTAGVVALEDVVEEVVGDIVGSQQRGQQAPMLIGHNRWQVGGEVGVHEWAEAFGQRLRSPRVATLGGLITATLGRAPEVGDEVRLGSARVEVERVERSRVVTAIVELTDDQAANEEAAQ
ncbi:MAG: hemolysin family protein [Planctomycetota bacterium]|jgi:CBS domain containing-hemolysin-like protein